MAKSKAPKGKFPPVKAGSQKPTGKDQKPTGKPQKGKFGK